MTIASRRGQKISLRTGAAIAVLAVAMPALAGPAAGQTVEAAPGPAADEPQDAPASRPREVITVTARRTEEDLQAVPIPVTALGEDFLSDAGAGNVGKLDEFVPSVQFYSTNPRNSAINIRGLGAPFGLTNDGIEQGVGLYIDGVYYARPAAATLDFIDIQQVEVLRGPQGTLYGKNTTAGAINVTTKRPAFSPETEVELSYGNLGFVQAKGTTTGPITDTIAARLSFSGTQRDGVLYDVVKQDDLNDQNNIGVRAQVLWNASDAISVLLSADNTVQQPEGYASIFAGVVPTLRSANRQYAAQAAYFNYAPPSTNAFDRLSDLDSPHRSYQELGGASASVDWDIGPGRLTSISAWRFWDWDPANDRDFLGLPITTLSQNPSKQYQWQQELRYAGDIGEDLNFVAGLFWFNQVTKTLGRQEQGSAAWRFLLNPTAAGANTPGLLDGYGQRTEIRSDHTSAALFGQVEWKATEKLRIIPGLRVNYDEKSGYYRAAVYGGLQTTNAALIALQRSVLAPQNYESADEDTNVSGQLTLAYAVSDAVNAYATYSTAFKTFGLNNNGVPNLNGAPDVALATVAPEETEHFEVGVKTEFVPGFIANLTAFRTKIDDYQVNVQNGQTGTLRGYLANAEEVVIQGVELDGSAALGDRLTFTGAVAWTDGKYERFTAAPPPLELSGGSGAQQYDASGTRLAGLSEWAGSISGEYHQPGVLLGRQGEFFLAADASYRSDFSSSPTESRYLNIDAYTLLNARLGFRGDDGWDLFLWGRNLADEDYFEILSAGGSSSGYYAGLPGDPRTYGVTLRGAF